MPPAPTHVFISYSHDSPAHMDAVLALANLLRKDGLDCQIDQFMTSPSEGWTRWCANQLKAAKFALVVCTETYMRRFNGEEEIGKGKGADFEGFLITQEIYDAQGRNEKFIPVVLRASDRECIPELLRPWTNYDVSDPNQYNELYWAGILGQPKATPAEIGTIRGRPNARGVIPAPLPALPAKTNFAPRLSNIPIAPNPFFTGRQDTLEELHKKLI